MSLPYIRKRYGVPASRGRRVRYSPGYKPSRVGVITGADGALLRIRFDGEKKIHIAPLHPTWCIEYLEEGGAK